MFEKIKLANEMALDRITKNDPVLIDVAIAGDVIEGLDGFTVLHAGPPITWDKMCAPMKGAVIGALKYEGLAEEDNDAINLVQKGKIKFSPCHDFNAVGPMTGVITKSMPVYVVENKHYGNRAYATINEGMGDVFRFGSSSTRAVENLKWITEHVAPALKKTIARIGGINLKVIIAQSLQMGDELHMRNYASTNLFIKAIIKTLTEVVDSKALLTKIVEFMTVNNDQLFLNLGMCACKTAADSATGIDYSTVVTVMARNGTEFGIKVSGTGNQWFTAPAGVVDGLYFPGYSMDDANPDIGDSAIMEAAGGVGGFAMATSPAIVKFLGAGSTKVAIDYTMAMYDITVGVNNTLPLPNINFKGAPTGIDIRKVIEKGILPVINTAIASKKPGGGMIGAGVSKAPMEVFEKALLAFAEIVGI
jgi:hypothetical protein